MCQSTNSGEPHPVPAQTASVLIIVDGPQSHAEVMDAYEKDADVEFRFMFGLFCPSVNGELARIQPVAVAPSPMVVRINELSQEKESPAGLALAATVREIGQYARYIAGHEVRLADLVTVGRKICISYNHCAHTGGFIAGSREPLINSLSELTRIYERGYSFYTVTSTAREAPITHKLPKFDEPLLTRAILKGAPFSVPL